MAKPEKNPCKTGSSAIRRLHAPDLCRHALAIAVGFAISSPASADAVQGFRLIVNDVISSRDDENQVSQAQGDRLYIEGLIQSDPDPVYLALQEKYRALPPFTEADEESAEAYVAEASAVQRMVEGMWSLAEEATGMVADVKTAVRYDDRGGDEDQTTTLATINPTFQYQVQRRKWKLEAEYDYVRGQYFMDRDDPTNDHTVDLAWTYRPVRGRELLLTTSYQDSHDRETNDRIEDFDSSFDPENSSFGRRGAEVRYRQGTLRDRSRFEAYAMTEQVSFDSGGVNDYDLDRNGIGGSYSWQMRRQLALVGEFRHLDFDYDNSERDYSHSRYTAGADVIVGRRLRTRVRAGYDFAEGDVDESGFVWNGMMEWALRRKTFLKLETGREIYSYGYYRDVAANADEFVTQDWIRTSWKERWTSRLSTEASLTYRNIDGKSRDEDANQFLITANYQFSDQLKFAVDAGFTRMDRADANDLDRRTLTFRADFSL